MEQRTAGAIEFGGRALSPVARKAMAGARRTGATKVDPGLLIAVGWTMVAAVLLVVGGLPTGVIIGFWLLGLVVPVGSAIAGRFVRRTPPAPVEPTNGSARIILPSSIRTPAGDKRS
ncbi:MAG: hypothetical protein AB7I38_19275 [Dehalococcoidia bacterium]